MNQTSVPLRHHNSVLDIANRLSDGILQPMKSAFVGKDEVIDLLGVSMVARENLFILGPPGTAKSALVQDLARRIEGRVFDYLLTRFTEPNEIFGPFDIRQLRDGILVTNTEGMLPEATFVFLDELLNANSAILNSLLLVLNERVFRRGRETRALPTLMVVGASNRLPEDDALHALFDRFLLRVNCTNVCDGLLADVLNAGWQLEKSKPVEQMLSVAEVVAIQNLVENVSLTDITPLYIRTILRLRAAGIDISDRRAVKLQRMLAASAIVCGRMIADASDLWVLRYIWETVEQQEILNALVTTAIQQADQKSPTNTVAQHPQSQLRQVPDAEALLRDMESLRQILLPANANVDPVKVAQAKDQLSVLASQLPWLADEQQRAFLQEKLASIWKSIQDHHDLH